MKNDQIKRDAAVAGYFYPDNPEVLRTTVRQLMMEARTDAPVPKALIIPHAGYVYSGITAAIAYATLRPAADRIRHIVLLGPAHRVYTRGLALCHATHFSTPLGEVEVDREAVERLQALPQVNYSDAAHRDEHSLEVHLPFLQYLLGEFTLVPLVVGESSPQEVGEVLDLLWGDEETVIIISSDLSHFLDYETASRIDRETMQAIEQLQLEKIGSNQACGCMPVRGLLHTARQRGMSTRVLDYRNSGDTAGNRDRVVGYGAVSFYQN